MARFNFKAPTEKQEEKEYDRKVCFAFGCPRLPTIKTGSWACRYHHGRNASNLDGITMILKNHEAEIDWSEKVMNMPFHEFDIFKDNAPQTMLVMQGEDLIKYRVRTAKYIRELLKHPTRPQQAPKTYATMSEANDD